MNSEEGSELDPQLVYQSTLESYTAITDRLRAMERSRRPPEERHVVDQRKNDLHKRLFSLGESLGKDKDQVFLDTVENEGNLRDFNISAPLIKLPMVGTYFNYDSNRDVFSSTNPREAEQRLPRVSLKDPDGEFLASFSPPHWAVGGGPRTHGKEEEIEKWDKGSYAVIVYQMSEEIGSYGFGSPFALPLNKARLERMRNLAHDFRLNLFEANDNNGHQDYYGKDLYGVEVPAEKIEAIAAAMRDHPDKYWLTPEELHDPFSEEYLSQESPSDLIKIGRSIPKISDESNDWHNWYNLLRVFHVAFKDEPFRRNYDARSTYLHLPFDSDPPKQAELFRQALKQAEAESPEVAKQIERLKSEIDKHLHPRS